MGLSCSCAKSLYKCSAVAELGDSLVTTDMGRKGGAVPISVGNWVYLFIWSPSNSNTSVPSGTLIHPTVWPQQTWTEKRGLLFPLFVVGGELSLHLTQPDLRPSSGTNGILIHPTRWPEYTNVTDKQDRQTAVR